MKLYPPARAVALKLMARVPNLIRRHMAIRGGKMVWGFDEDSLKKLAA
jgi:arsenate reductase-like glutaredoxin family protein